MGLESRLLIDEFTQKERHGHYMSPGRDDKAARDQKEHCCRGVSRCKGNSSMDIGIQVCSVISFVSLGGCKGIRNLFEAVPDMPVSEGTGGGSCMSQSWTTKKHGPLDWINDDDGCPSEHDQSEIASLLGLDGEERLRVWTAGFGSRDRPKRPTVDEET
jgi:hypothetical protein